MDNIIGLKELRENLGRYEKKINGKYPIFRTLFLVLN